MAGFIEKVTAFVIRQAATGRELLLFEHGQAGIQIPAGTVEPGESAAEAVEREVAEETGLQEVTIQQYLGVKEQWLAKDEAITTITTKVYARPEPSSADWAYIRRGITVKLLRRAAGFSQIHYQEFDQLPNPQYITFALVGWLPDATLVHHLKRHFFVLQYTGRGPERWSIQTDNQHFALFWAPLIYLPPIIPPQDQWVIDWLLP